jgi:hypothetical protein
MTKRDADVPAADRSVDIPCAHQAERAAHGLGYVQVVDARTAHHFGAFGDEVADLRAI